MQMWKLGALVLAVVLISSSYLVGLAESRSPFIQAAGTIVSFNNSPHSGLWAAKADVGSDRGDVVSVIKNDKGEIFIVTVKGTDVVFDGKELTIIGTGFIAKNGALLKEGSGKARINQSTMEIRIGENIVVTGKTTSFKIR